LTLFIKVLNITLLVLGFWSKYAEHILIEKKAMKYTLVLFWLSKELR
jgi:hypothetical protein